MSSITMIASRTEPSGPSSGRALTRVQRSRWPPGGWYRKVAGSGSSPASARRPGRSSRGTGRRSGVVKVKRARSSSTGVVNSSSALGKFSSSTAAWLAKTSWPCGSCAMTASAMPARIASSSSRAVTISEYRRLLASTSEQRSASSWTARRSVSPNRRPDSAWASAMSPTIWPPTRSGTTIADRKPIAVRMRRCSASCVTASIHSGGMSGVSSGSPLRITAGEPTGAAGSSGKRRSYSAASARLDSSAISITVRSIEPSGCSSSTKHQSARLGTSTAAIASSVALYPRAVASAAVASAIARERRRSVSSAVTSSRAMTTASPIVSELTCSVRRPSGCSQSTISLRMCSPRRGPEHRQLGVERRRAERVRGAVGEAHARRVALQQQQGRGDAVEDLLEPRRLRDGRAHLAAEFMPS